MKYSRFLAALALASLSLAARAAQEAPPAAGQGNAETDVTQEQFFDPQLELEHYAHFLELDDAQRAKVLQLLQAKLDAYKVNAAARAQFQRETNALHLKILEWNRGFEIAMKKLELQETQTREGIAGLLTEAQRAKFEQVESARQKQEADERERRQAAKESGPKPGAGVAVPK